MVFHHSMLGSSAKPLLSLGSAAEAHIDDDAAIKLANELATNTTATEIDLCNQIVGDRGAAALADALGSNSTLAILDLSMNRIGELGATAFLRVLQAKRNTTLESLDLSGNDVTSDLLSKIADALETRADAAPSDDAQGNGAVSSAEDASEREGIAPLRHFQPSRKLDGLSMLLADHGIELSARADGESYRSDSSGRATRASCSSSPGARAGRPLSRESRALLQVAASGHAEAMRALLSAEGVNIEVNAADSSGFTALMLAADGGWPPIVAALLAVEGIDVNLANAEGDTALLLAAQEGQTAIVSALLAVEGIEVNAADSESGATALILAAQEGHASVVAALLASDAGVNVNAAEHRGWTSLNRAAQGGHVGIVSALLRVPGKASPAHLLLSPLMHLPLLRTPSLLLSPSPLLRLPCQASMPTPRTRAGGLLSCQPRTKGMMGC